MKKITPFLLGLGLTLIMVGGFLSSSPKDVGAATVVSLGKNGTSEYLLYPTDTLSAYTFIATSTTASSSFANGINLTNGCFAIGSVCLPTLSANNTWTGAQTFGTLTASTGTIDHLVTDELTAKTSGGSTFRSANGTPVSILGVGNSANVLFYGGVNIDGAVRMATSLNGLALLTNGAVTSIATSSLGLLTTDVAEGTNLYFTNPRVQTYLDTLSKGYFFSTTSADVWGASKSYITLSSLSASAPLVYNNGTGAFSWTGLATTSQPASSNVLVSNGGAGVYGVATGTVSATLPISVTAGRSVLGGALSVTIADAVSDGSTKGAASFTANDFNTTSGNVSIDYTNGTAAGAGAKGFLTSGDWSTFNGKENVLTFSYPLSRSVNTVSLAFGTTTSNTWAGTQTFTNAPIFSSLTGILKGNGSGALTVASLGTDYVNGSGTSGNCVAWGASNALTDAGAPCGSGTGGGASQWATSTLFSNMVHTAGAHGVGIGTTTPKGALSMASSSMVEMWWNHTSASANQKLGWMSWVNGIFNIGTSSDAGATTSLLRLDGGTTTVYAQRLSVGNGTATSSLVAGAGTSTPNGGIDLSAGGCYAVLGSCIGVMALNGSVGQVQYYSGVNTAVGTSSLFIATSQNVGIGTTSPYAKLSVQGNAGTYTDIFSVASSSLSTLFNVAYNGYVGIGSSTPWGVLSIIDPVGGAFQPGVVTATSTVDLPFFGWTASTSEYAGSAVRILAGNPSAYMSSGDSFDQLTLNGRVNTADWKQLECADDPSSKTAQITSDITGSVMSTTLGKPCGDFSYIEDTNGVADQVVTTGSGYIRLRPGTAGTINAAGDGMGLAGTTAFLRVATNTPVFLATARMGAVQNASTSIYMLGFSAATGVSADYATDAQNGCFFVASSTKANWQAVSRNTTATIIDTGVASSTVTTGDSAWRQFRVDMIGGPTPYCVFRIKQSASASWGPPVATISTNIPTGVSLNPITSVGKVSAGISPELHINRIRVWYNDPLWQ